MTVANIITLSIVLFSRNDTSHAWVYMMRWFITPLCRSISAPVDVSEQRSQKYITSVV